MPCAYDVVSIKLQHIVALIVHEVHHRRANIFITILLFLRCILSVFRRYKSVVYSLYRYPACRRRRLRQAIQVMKMIDFNVPIPLLLCYIYTKDMILHLTLIFKALLCEEHVHYLCILIS